MKPETAKRLHDAWEAYQEIMGFVQERSLDLCRRGIDST